MDYRSVYGRAVSVAITPTPNTHKQLRKTGRPFYKDTVSHTHKKPKFKKIEIISRIFSDHYGLKLEINLKKKPSSKTFKYMEAK